MLDNSGLTDALIDFHSLLDSADVRTAGQIDASQSAQTSSDDGQRHVSEVAEPNDIASPATDAETTAPGSSLPVTMDTQRAGMLGNLLSTEETNETFGSGTNPNFSVLAQSVAWQNPLNVFAGDNAFASTSTNTRNSPLYPIAGAPAIFSRAGEAKSPSVSSATDVAPPADHHRAARRSGCWWQR